MKPAHPTLRARALRVMATLFRWLTTPFFQPASPEVYRQIQLVSLLILVFGLFSLLGMVLTPISGYSGRESLYNLLFLALGLSTLVYFVSRTRHYRWAIVAALLFMSAFPFLAIGMRADFSASRLQSVLPWLVVAFLLGVSLLSIRNVLILIALVFGAVLALPAFFHEINPPSLISSLGYLGTVASLILANIWYRNVVEQDRRMILKEAEEKYRNIVENAVEGIFQSTPQGRFLSVNPAMVRMYRYPSEEVMLQEVRDIARDLYVQPEQRQEFIRRLEINGTVQGLEMEERRRDGSTFWVSLNVRSVRGENGKTLYYEGTVEDISARKQYELERENLIHELEVKNAELEQFTYTVSHDQKPLDGNDRRFQIM